MRDHRFKGALINGHIRGRYLDDKFFWPILARAETLCVPIYIHPTQPPQPVIDASYGGFSPIVTDMLAGAGWGWHIETAVHVIRMVLGGVFDQFPKLQLVIGHLGETLPFMLPRLDIMSTAMPSFVVRSAPTCARTFTTRSAVSISLRRSWTYCLRSVSIGSCSRPIIRGRR